MDKTYHAGTKAQHGLVPRWVQITLGLAAALVALFAAHALFHFGGARVEEVFQKVINDIIVLLAAGACLGRAIARREARWAWAAVSAGMISWMLGNLYWTLFLIDKKTIPIPSVADGLWLGVYPGLYLGLVLLIRSQVTGFSLRTSLDGIIAGLAAASLSAAIIVQAVLAHSLHGSPLSVATVLSYPLGDLVLLGVTIGALAFRHWRFDRLWVVFSVGLAVFTVTDGIFLYQISLGTYTVGTIVDTGWLVGAVMIAFAAWQPTPTREHSYGESSRTLLAPALCGLIALILLVWDHYSRLNLLALGLTSATALAAIGRMALSFIDNSKMLKLVRFENETLVELDEVKEQLHQSQKMEVVGQLAGGIAHDFNNLLQAISGYAELASLEASRGRDDQGEDLEENLHEIRRASGRAAELTSQLLDYSRLQNFRAVPVSLQEMLSDVSPMLRRLIREDIDITMTSSSTPLIVEADAARLEQVIVNLAVNARDAMPNGGQMSIAVERTEHDLGAGLVPCALLRVSDDGDGMSAEVKERIFEPFYTTKEVGEGSGLGLASALGVVEQIGGRISAESSPGAGASFSVYLPLMEASEPVLEALPGLPFLTTA
jgi:signal transduction histidine kinase